MGCELAPGVFETSLYKMKGDNGPTLTFDSYNTLMHFFSTVYIEVFFHIGPYDIEFLQYQLTT